MRRLTSARPAGGSRGTRPRDRSPDDRPIAERSPSRHHRGTRGQTTLDFAFGIGIFLLVVAFVFLFVPSMLDPVSGSSQEDRVVADRVATQLATEMLVSTPANPYILDTVCTGEFFSGSTPTSCTFRFDGTNLSERLGTPSRANIRVQLTRSAPDPLSVSDPLGATPPSSGTGNVFVARRTVQYDGNLETLTVEVW